jgi:hypothetical protein
MKYILPILLIAALCQAADIADVAGLKSFASAGGTATIAPGTYTLDADLIIGKNCTLTQDGTSGDVIIDGADLYNVQMHNNAVAVITQNYVGTANGRIIFTRGDNDSVKTFLFASRNDLNVNFTLCDFANCSSGNGLSLTGNSGVYFNTTVICTDCRAYNNKNDGFGINTVQDATMTRISTLTLNNCQSFNNDPSRLGGGAGDGATAHYISHVLIINGGNYYDNGKSGVAAVGGSVLVVNDANFYDNGEAQPTNGWQIWHSGDAAANIESARCWFTSGATPARIFNKSQGGSLVLKDSVLDCNYALDSSSQPIILETADVLIQGNIFKNCRRTTATQSMSTIASGLTGTFLNNTFVNNNVEFYLSASDIAFYNNIFYKTAGDANAFYCAANDYDGNVLNGYNCFWGLGSETAYFKNNAGGFADTDIHADPCFVDITTGNHTLKTSSPCRDAARWDGVANLVGYFNFDENEPNNVVFDLGRKDIGYYNPDGASIADTCDMHGSGKINGAFDFNGVNDCVQLNNTPMYDAVQGGALTVSCWYKTESTSWEWLWGFDGGGYNGIMGFYDQEIGIGIYTSPEEDLEVPAGTYEYDWTEWNMFTWTIEKLTDTTIRLRMYINGVKKWDNVHNKSLSLLQSSTEYIGSGNGAILGEGSIDDFKIYNRVLTPFEIRQDYMDGAGRKLVPYTFGGRGWLSD